MFVEIVGGLAANSLAIITDAVARRPHRPCGAGCVFQGISSSKKHRDFHKSGIAKMVGSL